jgi:hypothetical protein
MLPRELLENLHADSHSDLAVQIYFIHNNMPNLYGDIVNFYKKRDYSSLLMSVRSLSQLYTLKPVCFN